jgi:glycosyltransferase involved in cell wall biosynthesis
MRIAQVSPLFESVPPKLYGGTERVVSFLTEELVRQGHEVTLFATGDSITKARLVAPWCCALRLQKDCRDQIAHHFTMLEMVQKEIENFDIVHYHIDYLHYPLSKRSKIPHVTTLHGRLNIPDLKPLYKEYNDIPVISISNSQREPLPDINWQKTIYHGLPENLYTLKENKGQYLAFIGRFSPEKGIDRAIELAIKTGIPLKIAAKIEHLDIEYFENTIKPLLEHPLIEYVGEIGEEDKNEFLGNAMALLFLINWPEPFGLAMIEAMACGTPVIAWNNGSVPEIIDHGQSGYIVSSMSEAEEAIKNLSMLSKKNVRQTFENKFSAKRMTENYLDAYEEIIKVKRLSELGVLYKGGATI